MIYVGIDIIKKHLYSKIKYFDRDTVDTMHTCETLSLEYYTLLSDYNKVLTTHSCSLQILTLF